VLERVRALLYKLQLPDTTKIHSFFSCIFVEHVHEQLFNVISFPVAIFSSVTRSVFIDMLLLNK